MGHGGPRSFDTLYSNFSKDGRLIDGLECARGTVEAPASELRSSWALSMASWQGEKSFLKTIDYSLLIEVAVLK